MSALKQLPMQPGRLPTLKTMNFAAAKPTASLAVPAAALRNDALQLLLIDDDCELAQLLAELLAAEGMQLRHAASLAAGQLALAHAAPDVLLLDLMLPDGSGLDWCRRLRQEGHDLPVLMLTARGDPFDRVLGLELGADDYLGKPFEPRELVARLRALARRSAAQARRSQLRFDGLTIDLLARRATCTDSTDAGKSEALALTSTEFKLLVALASQAGSSVSREALSAAVQPGNYLPLERAVDVQVARLRKKLKTALPDRDWIDTVRGEGYVFTGRAL
jgi:DNA-binding response OmpR family regulator